MHSETKEETRAHTRAVGQARFGLLVPFWVTGAEVLVDVVDTCEV